MRVIRVPDPRLRAQVKTYLDADYSSGTALTTLNSVGFAANDFAVIGEIGDKQSESSNVISNTQPTTINVQTAYNFFHAKGTTVYKSPWNYLSVESMPANGNWSILSENNIDWTANETLVYDSNGADTTSYRFRLKNSLTGQYSEYSPTVGGAGFTPYQVGQMVINVRKKIRDVNRERFQDPDIINMLQTIQRDIEMIMPKLWFLRVDTFYSTPTVPIAAVAGQFTYSLAQFTTLNYLHKIRYQYLNGANNMLYDLDPKSDLEFDRITANQNRLADDNIRAVRLLPPDANSAQGYFQTYPTPLGAVGGNFYPVYFRQMNILNDISDTTDLPFPEILEDGAAWRLHTQMGNEDQANIYMNLFQGPPPDRKGQPLTGLAMLEKYNFTRQGQSAYGKNLINYRGPRGRNNMFGTGIYNRDYMKEFYM